MVLYKKTNSDELYPIGNVVHYEHGKLIRDREVVCFTCPCDLRTITVHKPDHEIEFSEEGLLTIGGSCAKTLNEERKERCHFFLTDGKISFCDDCTCPGKNL